MVVGVSGGGGGSGDLVDEVSGEEREREFVVRGER